MMQGGTCHRDNKEVMNLQPAHETTTAIEIQKWKENSLDMEFLCHEDSLKEYFFWTLVQSQKDQLYDFYVREEARLMRRTYSICYNAKCHVEEKTFIASNSTTFSHLTMLSDLMEEIKLFQGFTIARKNDFIKVFIAYDSLHGTNIQRSELYQLRSTHNFLDGQRLRHLEDKIKRSISSLHNVSSSSSAQNSQNFRRSAITNMGGSLISSLGMGKGQTRFADNHSTLVTSHIARTSITESLKSGIYTISEDGHDCEGGIGRKGEKSGQRIQSLTKFFKRH